MTADTRPGGTVFVAAPNDYTLQITFPDDYTMTGTWAAYLAADPDDVQADWLATPAHNIVGHVLTVSITQAQMVALGVRLRWLTITQNAERVLVFGLRVSDRPGVPTTGTFTVTTRTVAVSVSTFAPGGQGAQGATGAQGDDGQPGAQGSAGANGTNGSDGPQGPIGFQGEIGFQGQPGAQGDSGTEGQIGPQGPIGADGDQGQAGLQGDIGAQGAEGSKGSQGAQGNPAPTVHSGLTGLGDDDHTQYALLAGRSGGQTVAGGTGSSDPLTLQGSSTSAHAGSILLNSPAYLYDADETFTADPGHLVNLNNTYTLNFAGSKFGGSGGLLAFAATFKFQQTASAIPTTIMSNLSTYTNTSGAAIDIGGNRTIRSAPVYQADGAAVTMAAMADFDSAPIFQVMNAGTLAAANDTVNFQGALTVGAGCTVNPYNAFVVKPPTGAGTVPQFRGFQVRTGGAPSVNMTGLEIGALTGSGENIGVDIAQSSGGTGNLGLRNVGATAFTQTLQTITATSDAISILGTHIRLNNTSGSSKTLASTPTVPGGFAGQILILMNTSANDVVLQDQGMLANSNLRLGASTRTLSTRDSIMLMYSSTIGDWCEIGFSNVL